MNMLVLREVPDVLELKEIKLCCPIHRRGQVYCHRLVLCAITLDEENPLGLWLRSKQVPLLCNNGNAFFLVDNPIEHSHMKHINIRHHFLRD
jgi:hypothetical protein